MERSLSSARPIWLQLKEQIAVGIVTGKYPPGSKLPAVRELAMQMGVNPNTMQRALAELERDGLARSMGTVGRLVTEDVEKIEQLRKDFARRVMQEYLDSMGELGYTPKAAADALEELL